MPANRSASFASGSGTPASSNMTRPGLTTATQCSGEPLPEPIRVSAGLAVTDLSGKMLIQTLPPRLILRVIAIRAASICRLVTQPDSSAFRPYSPNCTRVPPFDRPARRPRCGLRYFVRLGRSTRRHLPRHQPAREPPPAQHRERSLRPAQRPRGQPSRERLSRERLSRELPPRGQPPRERLS